MIEAIERARRYVQKYPPAISGSGGHDRTYHLAALLVDRFGLQPNDSLSLLQEWNKGCQPPWSDRELVHKVESATRNVANCGGTGNRGAFHASPSPKRPAMVAAAANPEAEARKFLRGFRCNEKELADKSPVGVDAGQSLEGALLVEHLFAPNERVNYVVDFIASMEKGTPKARPVGVGATLTREGMMERCRAGGSPSKDGGAWLRMNPVDGKGVADANVTAFRFALLESDCLPLEMQLALFAKMPLPIAAVITSGARSVHAWVRVDAPAAVDYADAVKELLRLIGRFGFDAKNKNPSRLSRLPGATRKIGATGDGRQRLLYLNPKPEGRSIF